MYVGCLVFLNAVFSFFVTTVPVPLLSATVMRMRIATTPMLFGKPPFVEVEQGVPEETLHENETKQVVMSIDWITLF